MYIIRSSQGKILTKEAESKRKDSSRINDANQRVQNQDKEYKDAWIFKMNPKNKNIFLIIYSIA